MTSCNDSYMNTNTDTIATPAANNARQILDFAYLATLAAKPTFATGVADHAHTDLCHNCPL